MSTSTLWAKRASPLLLVPVLALAAILRVHALDAKCIWLDESLAIEASAGGHLWRDAIPRNTFLRTTIDVATPDPKLTAWTVWSQQLGTDVHPPLYFVLLFWWRLLFGNSVLIMRLLSVVFSVAAVGALYACARELNGPFAALCGALIMALSGAQIQFAQEIRNYPMLLTFVLVAGAALVRMERCGPNWRLNTLLAGGSLAAMLTHYLAVLPLAAMALYAATRLRSDGRWNVVGCFAAAALAWALLWGPWLPGQIPHWHADMAWAALRQRDLGFTLRALMNAPLRLLLASSYKPRSLPLDAAAWLGSAALLLPPLVRHDRGVIFWWMLLAVPLFLLSIADVALGAWLVWLVKYCFASAPAVCMLGPALASGGARYRRVLLPAAVVILCAARLPSAYLLSQYPLPDYRPAAARLDELLGAEDALLVRDGARDMGTTFDVETASRIVMFYMKRKPLHLAYVQDPMSSEWLDEIGAFKDVWLLTPRGARPDGLTARYEVSETIPANGQLFEHLRPRPPPTRETDQPNR